MSTNRKRRLRKLTSAMIGAFSVAGSVANMNTNAQQETTSTLTTAGVGAGIISGLGILGLTAYNTFKDKKNPIEEEYRKLVLERQKAKKEKEEKQDALDKKKEEMKSKYGLSDAELTNIVTCVNTLRGGKSGLEAGDILNAISGMTFEERVLDAAKQNLPTSMGYWVRMEIADQLTLDALKNAVKEITNVEKSEQRLEMLTTIQLLAGVKQGVTDMPILEGHNVNVDMNNQIGQVLTGPGTPIRNNQQKAAMLLMPEKVKQLFGGCWGLSLGCPTLGKDVGGMGSYPYKNLFANTAPQNDGNNTVDGFRHFTLAGWNQVGGARWARDKMETAIKSGLDGLLGMDVLLGPDVNNCSPVAVTNSGGLGLGIKAGQINHLKKLSAYDIFATRKLLFETVYALTQN